LKVSIDRCVVVEDSSNGIRFAVTAGARVIAIPSSAYPPDGNTLSLATLVLGNLGSLTAEVVATAG